ncbi:LysM peptidoglycan-binding domain-containing protein [Deefgea sp. CFH1-16]|uniref:LysM peptidoglycan-binding domain-containing protein n=1 Tax=Deefgea sp. CFH1-16 TaxID=2675457 RepID=UPI0015F3A1D5|nr:LysM peptidoglycan-binding domain-containing protein [Deefgea sp. CFH1-16]MBM5573335.1 LysM peptidoglycan-binding domain-containing protein [Deefgea sp. CFH1-16]
MMRKSIVSLLLAVGFLSAPAVADELKLAKNAPDRYVVVKGDTLWGISGKFLSQPWRWPEIWQLNKTDIKNPHWIYPGDVIVLDTSSGQPRLKLLKSQKVDGRGGNGKLSPRIRETSLTGNAIASIPYASIEPFLSKPLVMSVEDFTAAPRIAAGPDSRLLFGPNDQIYSVDLVDAQPGETWQAFRKGKPLVDPDNPKEVIGIEVTYLGDVRVKREGDVTTMTVVNSREEISVGDRLIRSPEKQFINYVPHLPAHAIEGKVISTYGGSTEAGSLTTVVLNRGALDGLDMGTVLFSYKAPRLIAKETSVEPTRFTPPIKSGNLFVYRVFPKVAYALVMDSTLPINAGDTAKASAAAE